MAIDTNAPRGWTNFKLRQLLRSVSRLYDADLRVPASRPASIPCCRTCLVWARSRPASSRGYLQQRAMATPAVTQHRDQGHAANALFTAGHSA